MDTDPGPGSRSLGDEFLHDAVVRLAQRPNHATKSPNLVSDECCHFFLRIFEACPALICQQLFGFGLVGKDVCLDFFEALGSDQSGALLFLPNLNYLALGECIGGRLHTLRLSIHYKALECSLALIII